MGDFVEATRQLVTSKGVPAEELDQIRAGILAMAGVPSMVGQRLAASDPEPPVGSVVVDDCGLTWENDGYRPCCWVRPDLRERGVHDPETWRKIAGNYGPVTVRQWGQP